MNNNEQSNKKRTAGILLSILCIISLVLITAGVTYAFFSYAKEGLTENVLTTGTITFYYDETAGKGKGINITEAMPLDDNAGMKLTNENQVFDFQITSEVSKGANIPYMITVRKDKASTLTGDKVKVYLDVVNDFNSDITASSRPSDSSGTVKNSGDKNYTFDNTNGVKLFSQLTALERNNNDQSSSGTTVTNGLTNNKLTVTVPKDIDERIIYEGVVPTNSMSNVEGKQKYTANFRLRMWINGENDIEGTAAADYSAYEFVKKDKLNGDNSEGPLDAASLINSGDFITSASYYSLDEEGRKSWERIAYVNQKAGTFYSVTQAKNKNWIAVDNTGKVTKKEPSEDGQPGDEFVFSEQYYSLNGKTFKLTVNVYANAVVVEG